MRVRWDAGEKVCSLSPASRSLSISAKVALVTTSLLGPTSEGSVGSPSWTSNQLVAPASCCSSGLVPSDGSSSIAKAGSGKSSQNSSDSGSLQKSQSLSTASRSEGQLS